MEPNSGILCAIDRAGTGSHSSENPTDGHVGSIAFDRVLFSGYRGIFAQHVISSFGPNLKGVHFMPLTVLEIANKEFKNSLRGYNQDEVDEFLDEVMRDYEALIRENDELKQNIAGMGEKLEQYRALENTLQNTLVVAQSTSEDLKQSARKEAELVVREAQARARELMQKAESEVQHQYAELERIRRESGQFRAKIRSLLESQIALLNEEGTALAEFMPKTELQSAHEPV